MPVVLLKRGVKTILLDQEEGLSIDNIVVLKPSISKDSTDANCLWNSTVGRQELFNYQMFVKMAKIFRKQLSHATQ